MRDVTFHLSTCLFWGCYEPYSKCPTCAMSEARYAWPEAPSRLFATPAAPFSQMLRLGELMVVQPWLHVVLSDHFCICMHNIYIYMCVYTYVYVWTCICIYIYVCVCYVIVYVLIYVYLFSKTAKRKRIQTQQKTQFRTQLYTFLSLSIFQQVFQVFPSKTHYAVNLFFLALFLSLPIYVMCIYIYIVSVRVVYVMDMVNTKYIIHYSFIIPSYIYHLNHLP